MRCWNLGDDIRAIGNDSGFAPLSKAKDTARLDATKKEFTAEFAETAKVAERIKIIIFLSVLRELCGDKVNIKSTIS
jgi:hypothetical protein|tara:strand:- start:7146 stop:7376 length:231 start_codon:yes stop_codon:yes gene_type:complete